MLGSVELVCADGGYRGENFANEVQVKINADVEISKRSDIKNGEISLKRWIVERSFAWTEKCRRLWKNCERKVEYSVQFLHLVFIGIAIKRL